MNEVKRYEMEKEYSLDIVVVPVEQSSGSFVLYEDYEALAQQLKATTNSLTNAEEALKSAGIEADTVQAGVMELVDKLRIKQNHIKLRDTYIEELEQQVEAVGKEKTVAGACDACIDVLNVLGFTYKTVKLKEVVAEVKRLQSASSQLEKAEADISQLIGERDYAEDSISKMFEVVMGEKPEWSNWFIYEDAIDVVGDHVQFLTQGVQDD